MDHQAKEANQDHLDCVEKEDSLVHLAHLVREAVGVKVDLQDPQDLHPKEAKLDHLDLLDKEEREVFKAVAVNLDPQVH